MPSLNAIKSLDVNDPPWNMRSGRLLFYPGVAQPICKRHDAELDALLAGTPAEQKIDAFESEVYDPHITEADCRYSTQEAHELAQYREQIKQISALLGCDIAVEELDGEWVELPGRCGEIAGMSRAWRWEDIGGAYAITNYSMRRE
jgi:hypothetical protein